jgi:hypothetical protein
MAWRCTGPCRQWVYGIERTDDGRLIPSETAPVPSPKFISLDFPRVCFVCFQLYVALENMPYWKKLNEERDTNNKRRKAGESDDGYFPRYL